MLDTMLFYIYKLYGKPSLRQIPVLWLVLSWSAFCSADRFHGIFVLGRTRQIQNLQPKQRKKKVWILSFFTLKLPEEAKKIDIFPKFQRWMRKTNIFKCKLSEVHFTIRNRVPYNEQLTNQACSGVTGKYWPSLMNPTIFPSTAQSVSKRLIFYIAMKT